MSQTEAIVDTKDLCHNCRLQAPSSEIAAFFQRMFGRICKYIPPQLVVAFPVQLDIPMIHECKKLLCSLSCMCFHRGK